MKPLVGLIAGMERFAVHDGPGIRTLIFMKGCPLKCLWCSSPHTQKYTPELLYDSRACLKCQKCVEVCALEAITFSPESGVAVDTDSCDYCGKCARDCPSKALELVGQSFTPHELLKEVIKDSSFFRRSGGGVTVGGGEPTVQAEFVSRFLDLCQQQLIHTAIETCGYATQAKYDILLENLDLVFMDIKHMDDRRHRELTGVSNQLILNNARRIAQVCPLILRIPVVPGCNDTEENIEATAEFASTLGDNLLRIELLPYHNLGSQTYEKMGRDYLLKEVETPSGEQMDRLRQIAELSGVKIEVAGS